MNAGVRIAIPTPTTADLEYNRRSWPMYAEAVRQAGGTAVQIDLELPDRELLALVRECEGVLLPGSPADVDPARYGQEAIAECNAADQARENVDRLLLEEAYAARKPVLGICYGMQSLNVWRGGTMIQDLRSVPVNHSAGPSVAVAHSAVIDRGGVLGPSLEGADGVLAYDTLRVLVNSSHHQAVDRVGDDLRTVGIAAEDGVIEAIEGVAEDVRPAFVVGVQWHPERSVEISEVSRAIFRSFLKAAEIWAEPRISLPRS